jgi:hypothetical protein
MAPLRAQPRCDACATQSPGPLRGQLCSTQNVGKRRNSRKRSNIDVSDPKFFRASSLWLLIWWCRHRSAAVRFQFSEIFM